jgi:hypothetical protein
MLDLPDLKSHENENEEGLLGHAHETDIHFFDVNNKSEETTVTLFL